MTKYADIIARLEKATGPDRELDAYLTIATGDGPSDDWELILQEPGSHNMDAGRWIRGNRMRTPKPYTASIDASIALVERHFPGKVWYVRGHANGDFFCQLFTHEVQRGLDPKGTAKTAPLAILLSLFRALDAKEQTP